MSVETFNPCMNGKIYFLSEIRYGFDLGFNLKNKYEAGIGYIYKKVFQVSMPQNTSILSISISKSF